MFRRVWTDNWPLDQSVLFYITQDFDKSRFRFWYFIKKKKKKRLREHLFIFPSALTFFLVGWHVIHTENQAWNKFWWISRILGRELKNAWTNFFNTESSTDSLYPEVGGKCCDQDKNYRLNGYKFQYVSSWFWLCDH